MTPSRIAFTSTIVATFVVLASGQPRLAQQSTCQSGCTIGLQRLVTISEGPRANVLSDGAINILKTGAGLYLTIDRDTRGVVVASPKGDVLQLIQGPTDRPFYLLSNLFATQDGKFLAYDTRLKSLTTIDSSFKATTSIAFPYRPAIRLASGKFIHAEQIPTRERVGQPMHLLDEKGAVERSFGSDTEMYRADQPLRYDRIVAASSDQMIWAAAPGSYVLEKWNPANGQRISQVKVSSPWFVESAQPEKPGERPVTTIEAMWEVNHQVWVLLRDADSKWSPNVAVAAERRVTAEDRERNFDSVLEVVSIPTGKVIASKRFDRPLQGRSGQFILASANRLPDGSLQIEVFRPSIIKRQ